MPKRIVAALVLWLLSGAAHAGTALVSWGEVTQRVDGTPVTISTYNVYYGQSASEFPQFVAVTGGQRQHLFEQLAAGTWYFAATAVDGNGLESALSAVVSKTIDDVPPPPDPVPGLVVQESARVAYTLVQTADRLVLVPVGTASAGTPCQQTVVRDANGVVAYLIPRDSVQWAGTVRPQVVVAQCGN